MKHLKLIGIFVLGFLCMNASCGNDDNGDDNPEEENPVVEVQKDTVRFASYNVSMFGNTAGQIAEQVSSYGVVKFAKVARVIQEVRPDVLALMEFDYDPSGQSIQDFKTNYLERKMEESGDTIQYSYAYQIPSNTGLLSNADINDDGSIDLPNDAYGFGNYEGQYAFVLLSRFPLDLENIRSYQSFLWKDMPDALLPLNSDDTNFYTESTLEVFRVSSKNHIDIPVLMPNGKTVHTILAHPTPPVFDGVEDRNGKRNHDEIRLLADYVNDAAYLVDDDGKTGGLASDEHFVIMGDLNADPVDGDSANDAILQLLNNEKINPSVCFGEHIPSSTGGAEHDKQNGDEGLPEYDTSFFGLRIDYVLPSKNLKVLESGVFWPASDETYHYLVEDGSSSDHLLVWVDLVVE